MAEVTRDPEAWARLGAKIREKREAMGLSRRQLSEEAGVSEKSIQTAEEGRTPRARWPQSLRLIENALRWEHGSMERILEGGEPDPVLDLFSLVDDELRSSREQMPMFPSPGMEDDAEIPTSHARSAALARLPKPLRAALSEVLEFGHKGRVYGADLELVERYEEAVEALLLDLLSRPLTHTGISQDPGHLALWRGAMRMDPVLRREKEERMRAQARERRRLEEAEHHYLARRDVVVGGTTSADVLRELRKLAEDVAVIAKKVDPHGAVPGVDRSFTEEETEQQPKPSDG
ncbi:multiprotein-bridging factor 1 family protein [Streptomyces canus]|uniref:helix-turn-helix domain-containing protein n=1 Tax=Streptomyces canus TaxID=58343 RepID=UPI0036767FAD